MAGANVQEFTDANFEADVLQSPIPVLVDFWAEWCRPCLMMSPIIEEVADALNGKLKVGKLDTDNNMQTAAKYGIMSIPSLLIFKDGQIAAQRVGVTGKEDLLEVIRESTGVS